MQHNNLKKPELHQLGMSRSLFPWALATDGKNKNKATVLVAESLGMTLCSLCTVGGPLPPSPLHTIGWVTPQPCVQYKAWRGGGAMGAVAPLKCSGGGLASL